MGKAEIQQNANTVKPFGKKTTFQAVPPASTFSLLILDPKLRTLLLTACKKREKSLLAKQKILFLKPASLESSNFPCKCCLITFSFNT